MNCGNPTPRRRFDLAAAIERDELALHFQPRVAADSLQVIGAEALLRWKRDGVRWEGVPAVAELSADEFALLWRWELCRLRVLFARLKRNGWLPSASVPGFFVSLNLSYKQMTSQCWADELLEMMGDSDVPGQCLEIELTEQGVVEDFEFADSSFELLRKTGVAIALDDFPEGGSSFLRLAQFSFDKVKVDRVMVPKISDPIHVWQKKREILADLARIVARTGATLVIEGIETNAQYEFLSTLGAAEWQGFLWGKAVPFHELLGQVPGLCPAAAEPSWDGTTHG